MTIDLYRVKFNSSDSLLIPFPLLPSYFCPIFHRIFSTLNSSFVSNFHWMDMKVLDPRRPRVMIFLVVTCLGCWFCFGSATSIGYWCQAFFWGRVPERIVVSCLQLRWRTTAPLIDARSLYTINYIKQKPSIYSPINIVHFLVNIVISTLCGQYAVSSFFRSVS